MNNSNAKTMISPVYVGMQMQNTKTKVTEVGAKLTARFQDDSGEIASWVIFMVTLALAVAALATVISGWANGEVAKLPQA